ncbi:MKI67 FHA domain-interacting nucleolar phosphoprotein [Chelonus insularis]|uniref:MKI67 FHA domain-interacting nucleolar phosphoprotein n=1 Tax=Chelonus insularis TaxID=460826 RepID=UPI00158D67BE|nr:MKI67 FHA domain-interacting nucleolar phosphoprotein [Chelonus insularis]
MKVKKDRGETKTLKLTSVPKSGESSLKKAVSNVKKILKNDEDSQGLVKPLIKPKKEANIIKIKGIKKSEKVPAQSSGSKGSNERGIIYIGHIPHGFYEPQMKEYFSQFGVVTNVRVSRSKITGKSKGYGFVEFAHSEVAKIAAESMNNYLMFGRLVKTEYIPPEKQHDKYFSGRSWSSKSYPKLWNRKKAIRRINSLSETDNSKDEFKKTFNSLTKLSKKLKASGINYNIKLGAMQI